MLYRRGVQTRPTHTYMVHPPFAPPFTSTHTTQMGFEGGLELMEGTTLEVDSSTVNASNFTVRASTCTCRNSSVTVSAYLVTSNAAVLDILGLMSFTTARVDVADVTLTLSDASSTLLVSGDSANGDTQIATFGAGTTIAGAGALKYQAGLVSLNSAVIQTPVVLSSSATAAARRSLLQTSLLSLSPVVTACGSEISSGLTVASGAALNPDLSCTYGTETWNIAGSTSSYSTSSVTSSGFLLGDGKYT